MNSIIDHMRDKKYMNVFSVVIVVVAVFCGLMTYGALTESWPFSQKDPDTIYFLLNIDIVLFLILAGMIFKRFLFLWKRRKTHKASAKLQLKLVTFFSVLAVLPAVLMAVFSLTFFYFSIQSWFSERVSTAVNDSLTVAEAYLEEHQKVIKADILAMASDLNRDALSLIGNQELLERVIEKQSFLRNFSEVMIFEADGRVIAKTGFTFSLQFDSIPIQDLVSAKNGQVVLMTGGDEDRIRALVHLDNYKNTYLFVGRLVDSNVLEHIDTAKIAVNEYKALEIKKSDFRLSITLIFSLVSVIILLASMLFGLLFARKIAEPISALIQATDRIRAGDFDVFIKEKDTRKSDDMNLLITAFNKMTKQIKNHQEDLLMVNRELDNRRHFIEAVFSSVTTSIIGLDNNRIVTIANASSCAFFEKEKEDLIGENLMSLNTAIDDVLSRAINSKSVLYQENIILEIGESKKTRNVFVRIAFEDKVPQQLCVITLDDITELAAAQKQAAWSGVARRIAHEIKNPLTPIQLSAERLKRKYSSQISQDIETFNSCTDTIVRQVEIIGRMVNEFAEFARMPAAILKETSLYDIVHDCYILQKQAYKGITIDFKNQESHKKDPLLVSADSGLLRQALNNVIKNAAESLIETDTSNKKIQISINKIKDQINICIEDSGNGFNSDVLQSATEPYVTTKEKGTGLGLAIVKKIMEEHKGAFTFSNRINNNCVIGATVVLTLPHNRK